MNMNKKFLLSLIFSAACALMEEVPQTSTKYESALSTQLTAAERELQTLNQKMDRILDLYDPMRIKSWKEHLGEIGVLIINHPF